jgi:DHA2 family methylenomycin A resistance protein-like MFS transporter
MAETGIDLRTDTETRVVQPTSWLPLVVVCTGFFVVILDTTVVTIALDRIADGLHTSVTGLQWVVDGYTVVLASVLLLSGTISDRIGARRAFQAGLLLFGVASLGCAMAPSLGVLVTVRMVQGLGGALLIPSSLALIRAAYPDDAARAKAIGVWGAVGATAASFGPVVGGLLAGTLGWPAVFAINVPICAAALVLVARTVPLVPGEPRRLHVGTQVAIVAVVAGLSSVAIQAGSEHADRLAVWVSAVVFAAGAGAVLTTQVRAREPLLPRAVLAKPKFAAGNIVGFVLNFGFYGQLFVMSLFLQRQLGFSPLTAGLALLPETAMGVLASTMGGRVMARHGARPVVISGLAVGALGLAGLSLARVGMPYWQLILPLVLIGFGTAFCMPAATTVTIDTVPADQTGFAAAAFNTSRQIGGALGVAALGSIVSLNGGSINLAVACGCAAFLLGAALAARMLPSRPK